MESKPYSKIYEVPSTVIIVSEDDVYDGVDDLNANEDLYQYIQENFSDIKTGDIIHFESAGDYRNDGKVMWYGSKMIPLCYDYIDYGTVPQECMLELFPHKLYFTKSMAHNSIVFIDDNYTIVKGTTCYEDEQKYYIYKITNKLHTWYIVSTSSKSCMTQKLEEMSIFDTRSEFFEDESIFRHPEKTLYWITDW